MFKQSQDPNLSLTFSLLETLLWTPEEGYFLLEYHWRRLTTSASYFRFPLDRDRIQLALQGMIPTPSLESYKMRLLLDPTGDFNLQKIVLPNFKPCLSFPPSSEANSHPLILRYAQHPVDPEDPLLYHKTSYRYLYETAQQAAPDADDVLLWNLAGEVTETCLGNLLIYLDKTWMTPPVKSGLLPGTYRAWLLDQGLITEQSLSLDLLKQSQRLYRINSVRGCQLIRHLV
jgi:para-aminobenzoate synthetase/4-amino-4-deoxychorismate lyase